MSADIGERPGCMNPNYNSKNRHRNDKKSQYGSRSVYL
jgi:hypothetical protein